MLLRRCMLRFPVRAGVTTRAASVMTASASKRAPKGGYIGQGNRPAGEYHSTDFDWEEHIQVCQPILDAQLAAARQLLSKAATSDTHQQQLSAAADQLPHHERDQQDDEAVALEARITSGSQASPSSSPPVTPASADGATDCLSPRLSARARRRIRNMELKQQRQQQQQQQQQADDALFMQQTPLQLPPQNGPQPAAGPGVEVAMDPATLDNEWEVFFRAHPTAKFFRERRYLSLSFPCLAGPESSGGKRADGSSEGLSNSAPSSGSSSSGSSSGSGTLTSGGSSSSSSVFGGGLSHIVELGAGCGSSILPLLKAHPGARATVCDVSATCLYQLRAAAAADGLSQSRIDAFVADATDPSLAARLSSDPADVALIMFTLSAVPPGDGGMLSMLRNAAAALKPGGRLCIRDHGLGDMVQLRIPPHQVVFGRGEDGEEDGRVWYKRGDGTLAYFYRVEELAAMGEAAGLKAERCEYACVVNRNRRLGQELRRVFVQAEFLRL